MKMFKIIGIAVLVVVGAVLALAAFRPDSFRVQRAVAIGAFGLGQLDDQGISASPHAESKGVANG